MTNTSDFELLYDGGGIPRISFLMPVFQQELYVREAVLSVLRQQKVMVEILISDDCSSDKTYVIARETILEWAAREGGAHRVWLRQGKARLRRDHLPLLIDRAACDLVCQAHGDDLSHPLRAVTQVGIFSSNPGITLISVGTVTISSEAGVGATKFADIPETGAHTGFRYSFEQLIRGHEAMIGLCQSWRKSAVGRFSRLDSKLAPVSHDRILPFRAALAGQVVHVNVDLLLRREHRMSWRRLMFAEPVGKYPSFGWSLCRISALGNMFVDLHKALELGLVTDDCFGGLKTMIESMRDKTLANMLTAFRAHTAEGRQIVWVDEDTLIQLRDAQKLF